MNWEAWSKDMCALLDAIERVADDEDRVRTLAQGRFALAEKHGLTVQIIGSGAHSSWQQ